MSTTTLDRIEKQILLRHPRSKVWRALTDSQEFGRWFGVIFTEPFRAGAHLSGKITEPGYEHLPMEVTIERMEPERVFAFRWHPGATEPGEDVSDEPTTLVVFELEEVSGGTLLKVTESGFDRIPDSLLEASADLGGHAWVTFRRVILPLVLPAVVAGSIFTFSLTLGDYIVPTQMSTPIFIGNAIYGTFGAGNLPLAAALSLRPLAIVIVYLLVARRLGAFEAL